MVSPKAHPPVHPSPRILCGSKQHGAMCEIGRPYLHVCSSRQSILRMRMPVVCTRFCRPFLSPHACVCGHCLNDGVVHPVPLTPPLSRCGGMRPVLGGIPGRKTQFRAGLAGAAFEIPSSSNLDHDPRTSRYTDALAHVDWQRGLRHVGVQSQLFVTI